MYYPLQQNIDPKRLPIRTHDEILNSTNQIERLEGDRRETYIRDCGWSNILKKNKFLVININIFSQF